MHEPKHDNVYRFTVQNMIELVFDDRSCMHLKNNIKLNQIGLYLYQFIGVFDIFDI